MFLCDIIKSSQLFGGFEMIRRGILFALIASALVFSSCASNKEDPEPKELEAKVKTEVLVYLGAK